MNRRAHQDLDDFDSEDDGDFIVDDLGGDRRPVRRAQQQRYLVLVLVRCLECAINYSYKYLHKKNTNTAVLVLLAPHACIMYGNHIPGITYIARVWINRANPARGQLNREIYFFPVPVRA